MDTKIINQTILLFLLATALMSCVAGNEVNLEAYRATTVGQELQDLEVAREQGLLSEEEFEDVREEILKGGPISINLDGHD